VSVTLTDVPRGRQPTQLVITAQRWSCTAGCPQPDPWADVRAAPVAGKRPRMTVRLVNILTARYLRGEPAISLAEWCGVAISGLRPLLKEIVDEVLQRPRSTRHWAKLTHVGIDEIFWDGKILCVIVDLVTGRLLELLPDRESATLTAFLTEMNRFQKKPPVFVTDMWQPFREVLRAVYGKERRQVADRFHIQAKIGEDLRDVARTILPTTRHLREVNHRFLTALKTGGTGAFRLEGSSPEQHQWLEEAIALAVQATELWHSESVAEAEHRHRSWEWACALFQRRLPGTTGKPFGRLQHLLRLWQSEVFSYFDPALKLPDGTAPSSGKVEAANGKLKKFLRKSHHLHRRPFATDSGSWDEQQRFNRLWVRALYHMNEIQEAAECLEVIIRPEVPDCPCGKSAAELSLTWRYQTAVWDRPAGHQPVRGRVESGTVKCPACGKQTVATLPTQHGVTEELQSDLNAWRREGISLRTLHRWTGVSADRVRAATRTALPLPHIYIPALIGVQRWRWRGKARWVITDPEQGALIDILPGAEQTDAVDADAEQLKAWLITAKRRGLYQVLLATPEWQKILPDGVDGLIDRFTTISIVQRAVKEVQWRFTTTLSVPARRAPEWRRHRFVLLANPARYRRLDDRLAATALLERRRVILSTQPALSTATQMIENLRNITRLDGTEDLQEALQEWFEVTQRATQVSGPGSIERSLFFAFKSAIRTLQTHEEAVLGGLQMQAERGISLGASRRLLRSLNEHPAAQQAEFEYLRRSALHVLGDGKARYA